MKILTCLIIIGCLSAGIASADQFRVREKKGNETFDLPYARVRIWNGNTPTFDGWTDKYGRITINLPNGSYTAEVCRAGKTNHVNLAIDGQNTLKTVHVQ
jgi:hypothetical protein